MKKAQKGKSAAANEEVTAYADTLSGIQAQIASLEKKIDTLIARVPERSFDRPGQAQHFGQQPRYNEMKPNTNFRDRPLYKAVCADCNKDCEVPFKPTGERPVYCKECFAKRKSGMSFKENINKNTGHQPAAKPFYQDIVAAKNQSGEHRKSGDRKKSPSKRKKK
ncbi:MAG: hypothetical protein PHS37_07995 [Candidatus Omnitrophica bacterium]|nr:hypothetical protein [Candidatus Omnitrophota bacterium]